MLDLLDAIFPLRGEAIPVDHGYALYSAVSGRVPGLHRPSEDHGPELGIFPIRGTPNGDRLALTTKSTLRLRLPASWMAQAVSLAGASLEIAGAKIRVGVPTVRPLSPSAALSSAMVVIKVPGMAEDGLTAQGFWEAARRQLDALEIGGELGIPVHTDGPHAGQPRRRVMRIKGATRVGYPVIVTGLTADESLRLQAQGLGGRRRMGCGLFLPTGSREGGDDE